MPFLCKRHVQAMHICKAVHNMLQSSSSVRSISATNERENAVKGSLQILCESTGVGTGTPADSQRLFLAESGLQALSDE